MRKRLLINARSFPNNFDLIRFTLAASVILCHSFVIYYGYETFRHTEPFMVWSQQQIRIGSLAVDLFLLSVDF
jgi:peptidoglycan/LPS O-acetylase OafA/YrhL